MAGIGAALGMIAAGSAIKNGISSILGLGTGAVGYKQGLKMMEKQHEYDLEKMGLQHGYNIESQKLGQQFNKDLWDYTNYENQKQHLENAGLNPALLYGQGGGGGASAGGAQGQPSGIASGHEAGLALQGMGIGVNMANVMSQTRLNEALAGKADEEAKKIGGADTKFTEAQTEYYKELKLLTGDQRNLTTANYEVALQKQGLLVEEARKLGLENDWAEDTMQPRIEKAFQDIIAGNATIIEKLTNSELSAQKAAYIGKQIEWYAYEVETRRMSAEAAKEMASNVADRIANEWILEGRKLDIDEQRLLKEWIYGGLQQISGLIDSGTGAYKVFAKGAQQVIRKLSEKSGNNKGMSSWKEIYEEILKTD